VSDVPAENDRTVFYVPEKICVGNLDQLAERG
jgi:hypothetical protein